MINSKLNDLISILILIFFLYILCARAVSLSKKYYNFFINMYVVIFDFDLYVQTNVPDEYKNL